MAAITKAIAGVLAAFRALVARCVRWIGKAYNIAETRLLALAADVILTFVHLRLFVVLLCPAVVFFHLHWWWFFSGYVLLFVAAIAFKFQIDKEEEQEAIEAHSRDRQRLVPLLKWPLRLGVAVVWFIILNRSWVAPQIKAVRERIASSLPASDSGLMMAKQSTIDAIQRLLPASSKSIGLDEIHSSDVQIIDMVDISATVGKPRTMVLWMERPTKEIRFPGTHNCYADVYGDYWEGDTRLSLLDSALARVLNTIEVAPDNRQPIRLPFQVGNSYYYVPQQGADGEGKPKLMYLRDISGEGKPLQFALFTHYACGNDSVSVLGYSVRADQVLQYAFDYSQASGPPLSASSPRGTSERWTGNVFGYQPVRPGYWVLHEDNADHGGRGDTWVREVSFEPNRGVFVVTFHDFVKGSF